MATLKDIAKDCNVSISTVSRVLKYDKTLKVSPSTKKIIFESANRLGYEIKERTTIGIKIAIVNWYSHDQEVLDPYYYYIRKGTEENCRINAFEYEIFYKENDISQLHNFNAIIAIGKFGNQTVNLLQTFKIPIIFIDSNPNKVAYDSVEVDFNVLMEDIIDYVVIEKKVSITLMNGCEYIEGKKYEDPRLQAYLNQCQLHNLNNYRVIEGDFTCESGYKMFEVLHEAMQVPEVLICGNDLIAMGANKAAHELGFDVGANLRIIGVNNVPIAKYMVPSLTTVEIPQAQLGFEAVELVKRRIKKADSLPIRVLVPTKLVKRASC